MTRDECLVAVVDRLREGSTTADELSLIVKKNPRTIYRYIAFLKRLGVPIVSGAGAGYMMRKFPRRDHAQAAYTDVRTDGACLPS